MNAVCPGIVETPMNDRVLAGRPASAAECAGVICFLLSPEAGYMTGQAVNISGGLVTW